MLRFLQKTPEELRNQANVSAVISRPFVSAEKEAEKEKSLSKPEKHEKRNQFNLIDQIKQEKYNNVEKEVVKDKSDTENVETKTPVNNKIEAKTESNIVSEESSSCQKKLKQESKPEAKPESQINEMKTEERGLSMEESKVILVSN